LARPKIPGCHSHWAMTRQSHHRAVAFDYRTRCRFATYYSQQLVESEPPTGGI
jgi:hypothetical protein